MTKLAPINELALATGLILKTTNLELCPSYLNKLEQLRQAIISDFVNGLEPFGYFKAEPFGWTDCASDDDGAMPLYDLSDWSK